MSTDDNLDLRLRRGLRAAAEALPPTDLAGSGPASGRRHHDGHPAGRRLMLVGAAAVLVVAATAVGVTTLGGDADDTPDLQVAQAPSTTTTTAPDLGPAVDPVPGSAVVVGAELVSFGTDGQPGERLPLAPLTDVQAVTSDRHGGWIACGTGPVPQDAAPPDDAGTSSPTTTAPAGGAADAPTTTVPGGGAPGAPTTVAAGGAPGAPTTTVPAGGAAGAPTATVLPGQTPGMVTIPSSEAADRAEEDRSGQAPGRSQDDVVNVDVVPNTYLFRPGQDPQPLPASAMCVAGSLGVTEVDGRHVLAYVAGGDLSIHLLDLQTGADRAVSLSSPPGPGQATVGGGRLAVFGDAGLEMWNLATSEPVAIGPVDLPVGAPGAGEGTHDPVLSPDGTRLAALVGDISATSEVVVVDLASGAELFRHEVPVPLEGAETAFDGATVAVGNYHGSYGPVRIYDVATGTERTVDAHGLLP